MQTKLFIGDQERIIKCHVIDLHIAVVLLVQIEISFISILTIGNAAWYERRQMKKIYSPLLEGLLALYLGFEWIQVMTWKKKKD